MNAAKSASEKPKVSEVSFNIAKRKLEKAIEEVLTYVIKNKNNKMTLDMIGEFMRIIEVYKILYNPKFIESSKAVLLRSKINNKAQSVLSRQEFEKEFHINLWKKLNPCGNEFISAQLFKKLILLLYDSNYVQIDSLSEQLDSIVYIYLDLITSYN